MAANWLTLTLFVMPFFFCLVYGLLLLVRDLQPVWIQGEPRDQEACKGADNTDSGKVWYRWKT